MEPTKPMREDGRYAGATPDERVVRLRPMIALVLFAGFLAGCGGAGSVSATSRVAQQAIEAQLVGNPALAWRSLHPSDQRLVTLRQFVQCALVGRGRGHPRWTVDGATVTPVRIRRPGIAQRRGEQVRVGVALTVGSPQQQPLADDILIDVVNVDGQPRWLLDRRSAAMYRIDSPRERVCPLIAGSTTPGW